MYFNIQCIWFLVRYFITNGSCMSRRQWLVTVLMRFPLVRNVFILKGPTTYVFAFWQFGGETRTSTRSSSSWTTRTRWSRPTPAPTFSTCATWTTRSSRRPAPSAASVRSSSSSATRAPTCTATPAGSSGQYLAFSPHKPWLQQFPIIWIIDYRCDNRRFWLFAHNCQVPTPTSQNLELEQQIRIFGAD